MDYKDFNDYELIYYIKDGSEDANNIMIKKYEPLIYKIASKMLPLCKYNGLEINDLIQEGMIGLNHAIEKYIEQKDILFYTYAKKCIERKIISAVISSNRNKNKILNESISYDDDNNLILNGVKDLKLNPEQVIIDTELEEETITKIKSTLTDFEIQVFDLLIAGFNYKEIAILLDKNEKSIDNAIQRVKSKIKKIIK